MREKQNCSRVRKCLHHDVVERILERLPAESLLKFKRVSKKWRSTIVTRRFQERQLMIHRGDPGVLLVYMSNDGNLVGASPNIQQVPVSSPSLRLRVNAVKIPDESCFASRTSCDGLVCFYNVLGPGLVANPTTRWSRRFPPARLQQLIDKFFFLAFPFPLLGFGKDNLTGTFKPVFLYNSRELDLENATTCEVFDFSTNAWRYLVPSAPLRVLPLEPLFSDGSLHWFTEGIEETKVLSLHLHAETFHVISKAIPFVVHGNYRDVTMCSLNNRLCVSLKEDLSQTIWYYESGNNTWAKLYSIDLSMTSSWFGMHTWALSVQALPAATAGGKTKLLLYDGEYNFKHGEDKQRLVLHDPETKSYDLLLEADSIGLPLCYSQSLISIP